MPKKVFIDAGHGGADSGAVYKGVKESTYTLQIAKECRDYLLKTYENVSVKMSRLEDTYIGLADRCNACNMWDADIAVSIHINAGGGDGCEAWVAHKSEKAKSLATKILAEIAKLNQKNRGVKTRLSDNGKDYFAFNRLPSCPSPIIEPFFLDSNDRYIGDTKAERDKIAHAIATGIAKYLGLKKKETKTLKVGAKVKIKAGATDLNAKRKYKDFVYSTQYTVQRIDGSRVVFGSGKIVIGATDKSNIILV